MADTITPLKPLIRHDKYNTKCVCEVCTCGNHKCPRGQSLRPRFEGETTNQAFFDAKPLQKRPIYQPPKPTITNYDPDVLKSSYKSQFTGLPIIKTADGAHTNPLALQQQHKRAPFYGETSYKSTYLPKELEVRNYARPQYKPQDTKFEGTSAYKEAFQVKSSVPSSSRGDADLANSNLSNLGINRRRIPFEGQSAYKEQFQQHSIESIPNRLSGAKRGERPNTKFEGQSTYKQHFHKPEQPSHTQQDCPVMALPQVPREASSGKQHLNYSAQKQAWQ